MRKLLIMSIITLFTISSTGCVKTSRVKQSAAVRACIAYGGKVTYNTFSVTCTTSSGRSITTY